MNVEENPMLDVARGDKGQSEVLRASLKILRDKNTNPEFRSLVDDVLAGRSSLREVARSTIFNDAIAQDAKTGLTAINNLSEEEQQEQAKKTEKQLELLRSGECSIEDLMSVEETENEGYEFDPDDPLRRNSPEPRPQSRHSSYGQEEEEQSGFDPSDPLRRRR